MCHRSRGLSCSDYQFTQRASEIIYFSRMKLDGSVEKNVVSAIRSARRLRGRPVHGDTISHWQRVLEIAQSELDCDSSPDQQPIRQLIIELSAELASRSGSPQT